MEFFPPNKRTEEHLKSAFDDKGLSDLVKLHLAQVRFFFFFLINMNILLSETFIMNVYQSRKN